MFKRICKYEAICDICGKSVDVFGSTVKVAARNLEDEYNWDCSKISNPENVENNPCLDYRLTCEKCGKEIKK